MLSIGTLANIKHILEKEVFSASDERLLSVVAVMKTFKKKRACYLCIAATPPPFPLVTLCLVKQSEQQDNEYKKKRVWQLDEIKWVDGRVQHFDVHEFDMQVDKLYKWYAINLHERQNFLAVLYKQTQKYGKGSQIEFRNIPKNWCTTSPPNELSDINGFDSNYIVDKDVLEKNGVEAEDDEELEFPEFTALTEKETNKISKLFNVCEYAVRNAELAIENLSKELRDLDGANVHSVLTSEKQVMIVMQHIDKAISEAEKFEQRLDSYEEILSHVKETMEKISSKNAMIKIANNNNIKLKEELNKIIMQLELSQMHQYILENPELKTTEGRKAAIEAALCLQQALNSDIDPTLQRLVAARDQIKRFEKWKNKFLGPVSRHLNNLFIHLSNEIGDAHLSSSELILPNHASVHQELMPHTELMHWIKAVDYKTYVGLTSVYTKSLSKIYERDLRNFFALAKLQVSEIYNTREDLDLLNSSNSKKTATASTAYGMLGAQKDQWGLGIDTTDREHFDGILEKVLAELEPIALQEQRFCIHFFQMDVVNISTKSNGVEIKDNSLDVSVVPSSLTNTSDASGSELLPRKIERRINEDVRKLMNALFNCLEQELINFIQSFERFDCFYSLYVLERLTLHVMSAQDTHSFLSMTFASVLIHVKRNFDRFMQQQLQSIRDAKLPRRSKCGILPYVENFEYFAQISEEFFRKSTRRTDMEKFMQLINAIFEGINVHSRDHPKTPVQVIRMENYHHIYSLLAQLKVPALDELKKEAKLRYSEAFKAYVIQYFGRPLEKLNLFFEGVQQKIAQGVKETEISYQMAFSKQELRKVISQYPGREVKKGLENLYKKVEKHLCEEENLLQVVWHAMQEEFIEQYKLLEECIQKCYAGAMINLEFNIQDILNFFSDIARSH